MAEEKKTKRPTTKLSPKRTTKGQSNSHPKIKPKGRAKTVKRTERSKPSAVVEQSPLTPTVTLAPNLEAVLPTPLHVEPTHIIAPLRKTKVAPHRWSLRHNLVTIFSLIFVGALSLVIVAGYADVTFSLIATYGTPTATSIQPVIKAERDFSTNAGNLTMTFPERWTVTEATAESIRWELADDPKQHLLLHINASDQENMFMWLQQQQPTYRNAQVVAPTEAVEALRGIVVEATGEQNQFIQAIYFPHQKDLADKYIVSLVLEVPSEDPLLSRSLADMQIFVNNLHLE